MAYQKLEYLSDLTQKWLIYAEGKNTALVVGNTFALFKVIESVQDPYAVSLFFHAGVLCLIIGTLFAFRAIFPITRYLDLKDLSSKTCTLNPFSSTNLVQHSPTSLLKQLDLTDWGHFEYEFAEYLIGTARLIVRKYSCFKYGSLFTVAGIIILASYKFII